MKSAKSGTKWQKLTGFVGVARLRLAALQAQLKASKEHARLAKRKRKDAKEAYRRAKKEARLAKRAVAEAREILAQAEANLAKAPKPKPRAVHAPAKSTVKAASPAGFATQNKVKATSQAIRKAVKAPIAATGAAVEAIVQPAVHQNSASSLKQQPKAEETALLQPTPAQQNHYEQAPGN